MQYFAFYYQLLTARNSQLWNEVRWGIEIEADEIQIGCKRLIHAPVILTPIEFVSLLQRICELSSQFCGECQRGHEGPLSSSVVGLAEDCWPSSILALGRIVGPGPGNWLHLPTPLPVQHRGTVA